LFDSSVVPEIIEVEGRSYQVNELSFSDLQFRFATGRAIKKASDKGSKATGYRQGVMTGIGDVELSVWKMLIEDLIKRSGEEKLLMSLMEWASESCPWLRGMSEISLYALELHSSRIFDNPNWIAYREFNQKYRKEYAVDQDAQLIK
jgi:hypothetical protein